MKLKLFSLLAGVVIIAGCATEGYVEVYNPPIYYYEPFFYGPPMPYYGLGPYYHHYRYNYCPPPRHIPPATVHKPVPVPTIHNKVASPSPRAPQPNKPPPQPNRPNPQRKP